MTNAKLHRYDSWHQLMVTSVPYVEALINASRVTARVTPWSRDGVCHPPVQDALDRALR